MSIRKYMDDIQKLKSISKDDEVNLIDRYIASRVLDAEGNIVTQDIELRNLLVTINLKLTFKVAKTYHRSGIPFADLVSEGNLGLIRGIEKFDDTKGVKLGYYLYKWIRACILRYIVKNAHIVKMGTTQGQRKLFFNLAKTKARAVALQYDITDEEIAISLGVKVEEVREMDQRLSAPTLRIESSDNVDGRNPGYQNTLSKLIYDCTEQGENELPDSAYEREQSRVKLHKVIEGFLSRLKDRERDIFEARLLRDDEDQETFEMLGKRWGTAEEPLSKQRIQQIDADLKLRFKKYITHNQIMLQP